MNKIIKEYYFFGSDDSIDEDVLIRIDAKDMPDNQEERKRLLYNIKPYKHWNSNLIIIENGIITDCIYPKAWIDGLNNSLYYTYNNHLDKQIYDNPIVKIVERHKLLNIYKCVRTILTYIARSKYRTIIKPIMKGCHDFNLKIDALYKIDLFSIDNLNQPNANDSDVYKLIAFYLTQSVALLEDDIEIYTKKDSIKYDKNIYKFINRLSFDVNDLKYLDYKLKKYLDYIKNNYIFVSKGVLLHSNDDVIDMRNEIIIKKK